MAAVEQQAAVDSDKLMGFVFRAVDEIGATLNTALVVMGDRLGFYRALAGAGPLTPAELAGRTGTAERYVREWLNAQAAGGYVDYEPDSGRYILSAEHAVALTDESSPAYLPGFFQIALGTVHDSPRITEAAKTGVGIGWHDHVHDVHEGCEWFFRPGYNANLVPIWLPALDGVVGKLQRGARVADVGCGHGASTIVMAQAFPASTFVGSDYHEGSIRTARERAKEAGVTDRVSFQFVFSGVSPNSRRPVPRMTGKVIRWISSTRSAASSACTSRMLPGTWISPATSSLSLVTFATTSPDSTRVLFHAGSVRPPRSLRFPRESRSPDAPHPRP
jgi:hypothetical protein